MCPRHRRRYIFDNLILYRGKWNVYYGKDFNRTFKHKFLKGYTPEELKAKDLHTFRTTLISWFVQRREFANMTDIGLLQSMIGHVEKVELTALQEFMEKSQVTLVTYGGGFTKEHAQNELLQQLDYGLDLSPLLPATDLI